MEQQSELALNPVGMQEVLTVIASAGMKSLEPEKPLPEEGCDNYDTLKAQIEAENEQIKQKNEALSKLKAKIGFEVVERLPDAEIVNDEEGNPLDPQPEEVLKRPRDPEEWEWWDEKCCLKIS